MWGSGAVHIHSIVVRDLGVLWGICFVVWGFRFGGVVWESRVGVPVWDSRIGVPVWGFCVVLLLWVVVLSRWVVFVTVCGVTCVTGFGVCVLDLGKHVFGFGPCWAYRKRV